MEVIGICGTSGGAFYSGDEGVRCLAAIAPRNGRSCAGNARAHADASAFVMTECRRRACKASPANAVPPTQPGVRWLIFDPSRPIPAIRPDCPNGMA